MPGQEQAPIPPAAPTLQQEQLTQDVEAARQVTQAVGNYSSSYDYPYYGGRTKTEEMTSGFDRSVPSLETTAKGNSKDGSRSVHAEHEVSATGIGGTKTEYKAYSKEDPGSYIESDRSTGSVKITRRNELGQEVYTQTYRRPEAAQKFGSLIAKQVVGRANTLAQDAESRQKIAA